MGKRYGPEPYKPCPCGSGEKYKFCCYASGRPLPSPEELAISRHEMERRSPREIPGGRAGPEWFEAPFFKATVNAGWRKAGLADLYVFRRSGATLYGHAYLVDVFGLGLKDCYAMKPLSEADFARFLERRSRGVGEVTEVEQAAARSLVWGGASYADRNGFVPPRCWAACARAAGDDPGAGPETSSLFGCAGEVRIIGDWEDLAPRLARPLSAEEAMAEWGRRGFRFILGTRDPRNFPMLELE